MKYQNPHPTTYYPYIIMHPNLKYSNSQSQHIPHEFLNQTEINWGKTQQTYNIEIHTSSARLTWNSGL